MLFFLIIIETAVVHISAALGLLLEQIWLNNVFQSPAKIKFVTFLLLPPFLHSFAVFSRFRGVSDKKGFSNVKTMNILIFYNPIKYSKVGLLSQGNFSTSSQYMMTEQIQFSCFIPQKL